MVISSQRASILFLRNFVVILRASGLKFIKEPMGWINVVSVVLSDVVAEELSSNISLGIESFNDSDCD